MSAGPGTGHSRSARWKYRVGLTLFGLSWVPWLMAGAVPFLGKSLGASTALIAVLVVVGDVLFVMSVILLGKPFWIDMKRRLADLVKRARAD